MFDNFTELTRWVVQIRAGRDYRFLVVRSNLVATKVQFVRIENGCVIIIFCHMCQKR